jgi:hypothetical protein
MTPWWTNRPITGSDGCATGAYLTTAPIQARGGTVYYGSNDSVCAVDRSGIRKVASTVFGNRFETGPVGGIWLDGDRVIYTDGLDGVYAAPIAGGSDPVVLFSFTADEHPIAYDIDGSYFYWQSSVGISRRALTTDGVTERLLTGAPVGSRLRAAVDRVDVMGIDAGINRLRLDGGSAQRIDVSLAGALLASTGDFTYVRYASHAIGSGWDDSWFDLGVIDSSGRIDRAWTGFVPRIMPNASRVVASTVYTGGRLHYHDGAAFVGVVATAVGTPTGDVIGCYSTTIAAGELASVISTTADENGVYALVTRTDVQLTEYAIISFPLPSSSSATAR